MDEASIFLEALKKPLPDERAAFLDQACGGNAELRRSVELLLRAHDKAGGFLADSPGPLGVTVDQPVPEGPGTVIGPYKLIEQIGEGGMGTVWMAQQTEPVKRLVAVKLIKAGMDSRQVIARFEAERQALALMDHPNVARVLDAGTTSAGRPYFVMDWVKGVPITRYCDEQHLTPRQRLELFLPVCQAVQHAHQKGIIHRDLKPSNVLVALYDGKPVPKVIDFGVAKAAGQPLTDKTLVTGFGAIVGTLEYMSPEQAEINQLDIDTRSDIYSLGVLLYELLTGSPPFSRKELEKSGMLEMLRVIREQEPSKPSTKLSTAEGLPTLAANRGTEPAKLTKLVRGELDWIVMKALEKDRSRRYETANGFAMDVQRYLADEAVLACPPSVGYRFRKFARRNKGGLAVAALVLFFLVLVGSGAGWAVRDRSAREAEAARQQAERQGKVAGQVESIFAEVDRLESEQKWPEALTAARRAEAVLAAGEADPATTERVRERLKDLEFIDRLEQIRMQFMGVAQDYAGAFRDYGVDVEELAVEASIDRLKTRPQLVIPVAAALDRWVRDRRMVVSTVSGSDDAGWKRLVAVARGIDPDPLRDRLRAAWGRPASEVRDELRRLADSIDVRAHHPATLLIFALTLEGIKDWDSALRLLRDAQYVYPGDYWLNSTLGNLLSFQEDHEGALRYYTAAVSIRPRSWAAHYALGSALEKQKKVDEAIVAYRKAIELDPGAGIAYDHLGGVLRGLGRLDEAVAVYREQALVYPKHSGAWISLGFALRDQKKLDEANDAFARAIELAHEAIQLDRKNYFAYEDLGRALAIQGKLDDAIAAYRQAIEHNPNDAAFHYNLGVALAEQKKWDDALAAYRKAIKLDPKFAPAHHNLGVALAEQKKLDEAIDAYRTAIKLDPKFAPAHHNLGIALHHEKKLDEAIAAFRTAIKLDSKNAWAHHSLGCSLATQGKLDDAIAAFRKAIDLDPKNVNAYRNLGLALKVQKKLDEAIDAYRKAIEPDQKDARGYFGLGKALEDQGKLDETIACFEKAVELDANWAVAHNALAWLLTNCREVKLRDPQRGLVVARKAVDLAPYSAFAWQMLGWAHYRAGDWKASIETLEKSCALDNPKGGDAFQWFFLAMAHWRLGDKDKAREFYDRAVQWTDKNQPNNEDLRRFRAEAAGLLELKEKK